MALRAKSYPPQGNARQWATECTRRGSVRSLALGGRRRFALLAPRPLLPSGHLRCASSTPPGISVVGAQTPCAQPPSQGQGRLRRKSGTARRPSLHIAIRAAWQKIAPRTAPRVFVSKSVAAPNAREAAPDLAPRSKRAFGTGMQITLRRGLCGILRWGRFLPAQTLRTRVSKKPPV
jgi:hypothetical protein